jgi:serine/threonine-protein kinase
MNEPEPDSPPRQIGRYRLDGMLGQGAMGVVYRARDTLIERTVALKTVRRDTGDTGMEREMVERFRKEAQAAGRLMHPNIVTIHDYGETDELAYIAMEFVDGTPLSMLIGDTPVPPARALAWFADLLAALDYAHANGVVHRDVKPANLLVTRDDRVKISDFGIARVESSTLTQIGAMLGTPSYMSPEQFRGDAVDGRSDLFSAGVVLYQMLTGQRPFSGSAATVMQQVLQHTPPLPSIANPALSPAFDAVVMGALAKEAHARHASARDFQLALSAARRAADTPDTQDATVFKGATSAAEDDATILAPPGSQSTLAPLGDWAERPALRSRHGDGGTTELPGWLATAAPELEALLTRQIGPMAKLLLRRVARTAPDFDTLTAALVEHIPSVQARAVFEQGVTALRPQEAPATRGETHRTGGGTGTGNGNGTKSSRAATQTASTGARMASVAAAPITAAEAQAYLPLLAAAIGPIASIVVKRALRTPCTRAEFLARVGADIEADATRMRFLEQAAGVH